MRTAEQVIASAAGMQACLDAGLPREQLVVLVVARQAWRARVVGVPEPWPDGLEDALAHPAAAHFDDVFSQAARKALRRW